MKTKNKPHQKSPFLSSIAVACLALLPSLLPSTGFAKNTASLPNTRPLTPTETIDLAASREQSRHTYQLDNGLKVIIQEDHRTPIVMTQVWYRVGATDEPTKLGGISHLLEHMMFKGTSKVSSSDFEQLITKFGGSNNAFTTHDYTGYYELLPANYLGLALELEADRMTNLKLREEDFSAERQVVMEERRQRTDDNPNAQAFEQFSKLAYPDSPRGESVIGPMKEIAAITLPDLQAWYQRWYRPNNATLVIVGDVKPDAALAEVKRYFADIPAGTLPTRPSVTQSGFRGFSQTTTQLAVQVPSLLMAYNLPTLTSASDPKTAYTLALLAQVLDGGLSARLEKHLVRDKGLLSSVSSGYDAFGRGDGLLLIHAVPRQGVTLEQAQAAILDELAALKTQPIASHELERAKTNTITALVYSQDSISGQAQLIGSLDSIGLDDRLVYQLPAKFAQITPQDLQAVAKQFLVKDNLTVLNVLPNQQNPNAMSQTSPKPE